MHSLQGLHFSPICHIMTIGSGDMASKVIHDKIG